MDWGSIVLVVDILLLVAGWLLFQQARTELTARAAELPVLSEVRALQHSITALIEQLKLESGQASAQLEARCLEARDLLAALERRLESEDLRSGASRKPARKRAISASSAQGVAAVTGESPPDRYSHVYEMSDAGAGASEIALACDMTAGEVDLILGLRRTARAAEPAAQG